MTNKIALWLGLFIAALACLDLFMNEGAALFFLARKLYDFLWWIAFWR